jgi:hypothetical protein
VIHEANGADPVPHAGAVDSQHVPRSDKLHSIGRNGATIELYGHGVFARVDDGGHVVKTVRNRSSACK